MPGKESTVAGHASGEGAIEHINPTGHSHNNILGGANAHQVARSGGRKPSGRFLDHPPGHLLRLADAQSPNAIAGEVQRRQGIGGLTAQSGIHAPLDDSIQRLVFPVVGLLTAPGPEVGAGQRFLYLRFGGIRGGAFVQDHDNISAECFLITDGQLRREEVFTAVNV